MKQSLHIAYVAGLLDGEGNICIGGVHHKGKKTDIDGRSRTIDHIKWSKRVSISNTDLRLIKLLQTQFGGWVHINGRKPTEKWKQAYVWSLGGTASVDFLLAVYPYLILKKDRADIYLEFMATRNRSGQRYLAKSIVEKRLDLYARLITLNSRGTDNPLIGKLTQGAVKAYG